MKYKVGDKVKVVACDKGHQFSIGEVVTITEEIADGTPPHYRADSDTNYWWLTDEEIELYEEPKMPKYTTEPIDYTGCHPVIAEHLKRGEAILCRVRDSYSSEWYCDFLVSGYRSGKRLKYTGWFVEKNENSFTYAEPIPTKRKVLMSAEKAVVKLIENGSKIDKVGCIDVESKGECYIYLSSLKEMEGKEKEKTYLDYPDYLFEEVDD